MATGCVDEETEAGEWSGPAGRHWACLLSAAAFLCPRGPRGKPSGQARCPVVGMPTEPCDHHRTSKTFAAQRRPPGPRGPQASLCPVSFRSGSLETVWAEPGSSAWPPRPVCLSPGSEPVPSWPGGNLVQLALLRLGHAWRSGLALEGGPGPSGGGRGPCPAPPGPGPCLGGGVGGLAEALTACAPVPQLPHCPGLPHLQRAVHHRAVCRPGHRDPLLDGTYQREGPCALAPGQVGRRAKPATPGLSHPRDPVPAPRGGLALWARPDTGGLEAVGTLPSWLPTLPGCDHWAEKAEE